MILNLSESEEEYVYLALHEEIRKLKQCLKEDPGLGARMKLRIVGLKSVFRRLKLMDGDVIEMKEEDLHSKCTKVVGSMKVVSHETLRTLLPTAGMTVKDKIGVILTYWESLVDILNSGIIEIRRL